MVPGPPLVTRDRLSRNSTAELTTATAFGVSEQCWLRWLGRLRDERLAGRPRAAKLPSSTCKISSSFTSIMDTCAVGPCCPQVSFEKLATNSMAELTFAATFGVLVQCWLCWFGRRYDVRPARRPSAAKLSSSTCRTSSLLSFSRPSLMTWFLIALLFALIVPWQTGWLGIRVGEASLPGHSRRAAKGYSLARKVNNITLRSHNTGGIRCWDKKAQLWNDGCADVHAIQETWADAKDVLDSKTHGFTRPS